MNESELKELEDHVISRIKHQLNDITKEYVQIKLSVNLSCTCCREDRYYFSEKQDLLGKTDKDLLHDFEMSSQTCLNHAVAWSSWYDDDIINIDEG